MGRIRDNVRSQGSVVLDKNRRREDYEAETGRADFMLRSYLGGEWYDPTLYLDKYPREDNATHTARKERSYYLNYLATVIDSYAAEVFKWEPSLEIAGPEALASRFVEDATGDGTELNAFVRDACIAALLAGRSYVGVDLDPAATNTPYAYSIHPANLLDFSLDKQGQMRWALVAEEHVEDSDPFVKREKAERFRLWKPDEWMLFGKQGNLIDSDRNGAGRVPVVVLDAQDVRLPAYDIARACRRIFNTCSQIDEILIQQTFSQFYFQSGDTEDPGIDEDNSVEVGTNRGIDLPLEARIVPGYAAPPDGPVKMHMEERENLVKAVYAHAGLERRDPDSQTVQSGVAKSYDFKETNARLSALAQMAEKATTGIFDVLADYGVAGPANVTYRKDFDVRAFEDQLEAHIRLMDAKLPPVVVRRSALDLSLRVVEEGTEDEKREVSEAIEAMDDSAFSTQSETPLLDRLGTLGGGGGIGG